MTPPVPPGAARLNVIALVSGGKDSFFSLLHCRANGHRVVALANLHPPASVRTTPEGAVSDGGGADGENEEVDLNSFMYQTVGHQVIPLYADATGIPLYRRAITGGAAQTGKEYSHAGLRTGGLSRDDQQQVATDTASPPGGGPSPLHTAPEDASVGGGGDGGAEGDETEAMVPLLRSVMTAHPEANALCAGAILSTYQRTRVESVALRLGLTPLAYLWKYPTLPTPSGPLGAADEDDAQLLADMAAAGLEARLVKVATGGMDESFLWENVASESGRARIKRAMRRFAGGGGGVAADRGAVLGEGGEFETLVVDGPRDLFRKRIAVHEEDRRVVREGGGSSWLRVVHAQVEDKTPEEEGASSGEIRIPDLLDARFADVFATGRHVADDTGAEAGMSAQQDTIPKIGSLQGTAQSRVQHWCVVGDANCRSSIETEAASIVETVKTRLRGASLPPTSIINTIIVLRNMGDFPAVNKIYGSLFTEPNPPSRVTISSGDLLPDNCRIALYLSVHIELQPRERQGLHVQSRSYWAPANIGPYSQATAYPLSSLASPGESAASPPQLVYIAGQIPLIPATMDLPTGDRDETFRLQLALSLQHLWRVGIDVGVRWWSSAVAYLPRDSTSFGDSIPTSERAKLAVEAWRAAHRWSSADDAEDEDEEGGPDLWDRKYNPLYMSFAESETQAPVNLPDWSVLESDDPAGRPVPFIFAAEVQELPRQAGVEWHAHSGLACPESKSVRIVRTSDPSAGLRAQQTVVATRGGSVIQSVLALGKQPPSASEEAKLTASVLLDRLGSLLLPMICPSGEEQEAAKPASQVPILLYADSNTVPVSVDDIQRCPIIPCASIWGSQGERLQAVAVYQNVFEGT